METVNDQRHDESKKERIFPTLELTDQTTLNTSTHPVLIIQSPKTPTLSRKLKAVSLDSDLLKQTESADLSFRDVFSMPNTPKKQLKQKLSCEYIDESQKMTLAPTFSSNLKKFASNNSISGSQTLKTLPEVMTLQDFNDHHVEPIRIKAKGLLERRGSNASLTIDLGSSSNVSEVKPTNLLRLNTAKSVSNLNLSTFGCTERCSCIRKHEIESKKLVVDRRKSQETCGNCIIYESIPSKANGCKTKCQSIQKRCSWCIIKCRRKSLSNENLYIPPCSFCQSGSMKECTGSSKHCKGYRKAYYPRQPDIESSQLLSEDFKMHLQNIQYLQTAGSVLSISDLKSVCQVNRVPKLHQEFWEVPLNLQEKCYVSGSQSKNRYRGVLPNEHSRVHLPEPQPYIHANYIKGPDYTETTYIATQGPMAHTCHDFWDMVWHSNCQIIVMLTGLVEKGKNKCELYFPLGKISNRSTFYVKTVKVRDKFTFDKKFQAEPDEEIIEFEALNEIEYDNYRIKYLHEDELEDCTLRYLELSRREKHLVETRKIFHYWFTNWQDHKMANPRQVLDIALDVLRRTESSEHRKIDNKITVNKDNISTSKFNCTKLYGDFKAKKPIDVSSKCMFSSSVPQRKKSMDTSRIQLVVHCSAGIGRTGCFLAILNGIKQLRNNFNVDVLAIMCSLRLNRGGMVQTAEQYELIHRVLSLYTDLMMQT